MSRQLLCLAFLLLGTGCQSLHESTADNSCLPRRGHRNGPLTDGRPEGCGANPCQQGACPPGPCPSAPCAPAAPVCQPPPPKVEAPRPPVRAPAPVETQTEVRTQTQQAAGAVAQDILLVPRTVYVPYAAQVPVAPARLAGLAAPGPVHTVTEQRTLTTDRQPAVAECRESDTTTLELLKALRALNDKLDEQRKMMTAPVPERLHAPAPIPESLPPPCPAGLPPCSGVQPSCTGVGPRITLSVHAPAADDGLGLPLPPIESR
jgi:hypothetical protein